MCAVAVSVVLCFYCDSWQPFFIIIISIISPR